MELPLASLTPKYLDIERLGSYFSTGRSVYRLPPDVVGSEYFHKRGVFVVMKYFLVLIKKHRGGSMRVTIHP